MSLYDKSSLIQVPSLYKDGTLVSTIPEDRSGDFTVVRGSNLSATRVGEDGYIKKGYENLLLQSNSFITTWTQLNILPPTSGQTGYDGSTDAWYFEKTGIFGRLQQSVSTSGVQTFSVYLKAKDLSWVNIQTSGAFTSRQYFDLTAPIETAKGLSNNIISSSIEDAGDGWRKCSITYEGTKNLVSIYPADGDGNISGTSGSIYIQDAMLNQGLVAYPYLETTTASVQGGLLENTPRLDWSNGVPTVLVEEGRTNIWVNSEYIAATKSQNTGTSATQNTSETLSPEGLYNACKLIGVGNWIWRDFIAVQNVTSTISGYVKAVTSGSNNTFRLSIAGQISDDLTATDEWQRFSYTALGPAQASGLLYDSSGNNANLYVYGFQVELGASTPSSYIPTYGTSQTRSSETISDNFNIPTTATIYNSFYSDVAETVFVLDQVFDVAEGLNKVAIAFSPTAVKISVGGSIVANATGTYDTSSLTNIQLGSDNGSDYSNAPISGFYVFPEFLTDEELNSLTD